MTAFCSIADPSHIKNKIVAHRVKKKSASGHTRLRSIGRRTLLGWVLTWSAMTGEDLAILYDFFDENNALEFDWMHPLTGVTHTVFFESDDIDASYLKGAVNRWQVSFELGLT